MCGALISLVAVGRDRDPGVDPGLDRRAGVGAGGVGAPGQHDALRRRERSCGPMTVEVPVVVELMVVVHDPVPPAVVQLVGGLGVEVAPLASTVVKVMTVPSGAFWKPPPSPRFDVDVRREGVAGADPVGAVRGDLDVGVLKVLIASPLLPPVPSVCDGERRRAVDRQRRSRRDRSRCPGRLEVKVTVNWPAASVVPVKGPGGVGQAPLE